MTTYYYPSTSVEGFESLYGSITLNNCLAVTFTGGYEAVGVVPSPKPAAGAVVSFGVWAPSSGIQINTLYENSTSPYVDNSVVTLSAGWNTVAFTLPTTVTDCTLIGFQAEEFTGTLLINNVGWTVNAGNTVTVTNPGGQTLTVGTTFSLQMSGSDSASGQTLTYSATGLPAGLSISSSGDVTGTPTTAGSDSVTVTATDTTGANGSATFTCTVNTTVSNVVTVTNPGNQTLTVGTAFNLQVSATDSQSGQTLTFTATGLPAGLSISSSGGISGTPTTAGSDTVTITATDTTGAHGSAAFTATVNAAAPSSSGLVYMGGYTQGGGNAYAADWAEAQGVPAAGGFQSAYQWGNGWTGSNSVESVQVSTAQAMAGYAGPCCLNIAMCESDNETSLANSLSGSSLTSGCQTAHAATAVACLASNVQFIRMAWEFNGGQNYNWMPPFSSYTAAEFKLLWQLIYNVYSSAAVNAGKPSNWFQFIYCMVQNDSNGNADMSNYYPGAAYAQYVTIDEYDRTGGGYTGWAEAINDQPTLTESVTFALAQGAKGVGFPEWGIRDDAYGPSVIPDPSYINSAFSWAQSVTEQGLNVLMWPWGAGYSGSISGIPASSWNFAAWPTMWSALTSNVATGVSEGWIATTNPT